MVSLKPIQVVVRLKNNRLVKLREQLGLSQRAAAAAIGVDNGTLNSLEGFRLRPIGAQDDWTPAAQKVADYYGVSPEYLWPTEVRQLRARALRLEANTSELTATTPLQALEAQERLQSLATEFAKLDPREQAVLTGRVVEARTYEQLAIEHGISRERIRQIESGALSKLSHGLAFDVWRSKWGRDIFKRVKPLHVITSGC